MFRSEPRDRLGGMELTTRTGDATLASGNVVTVDDCAGDAKGRFRRNELCRERYEATMESSKAKVQRGSNLMLLIRTNTDVNESKRCVDGRPPVERTHFGRTRRKTWRSIRATWCNSFRQGMRIRDSNFSAVQSQSCTKIRFLHLPPRRLREDFNAAIL